MKRNRKAKILATLGPASSTSEVIENIFNAGCDVFRLNFSHGSIETHRKNLDIIRGLEKKYNHATFLVFFDFLNSSISFLLNMCGGIEPI